MRQVYRSMKIAEKLAELTAKTSYSKIPEEAVQMAKLCFVDFLCVALRGSQGESSEKVRNIIFQGGSSSIIGAGKSSPLDASLANGVAAHSMDLDDGHRFAQLHPGCCVIPAALALCESQKKDGKDFISSIVAGYNAAVTIGMIANPQHRMNGFHSTGTCGTFGAAAAASRAMDLDLDETVNALGLAGTQAAGLLESDHAGTMGKHLHAGKAAQSGVISALLAREGFTGAESIIEGKEGFLNGMAGGCSETLLESRKIILDDDLLRNPHILEVYFKKYPLCRHLHSSIDALMAILSEIENDDVKHDLEDEIKTIIIRTYRIASEHNNYQPQTPESLRQSLPMSIATAVLNGLNLEELDMSSMKPEINAISNKVKIVFDEDLDDLYPSMRPSEVTLTLKNGKKYIKRVDLPLGEPENPLKRAEIIEKFQRLNPDFDVEVLEVIEDIESCSMCDLMDVLDKNLNHP
ncbi:MmgE/PrpD family protein [Methanobacterium aggregans]|uniref:MmgE/PrpD family protein n=2 Tax=Methanobacterium aggregans TaxID=1615586 RepID=UPI001AEA9686|nr:MmgE/PrpD family protein [Methanobacterium aggregans]MBP2046190.1 2-methylcitrate dehydratase PrpD [Methanobacterium aggregans]